MTVRELLEKTNLEGGVKIQEWRENEDASPIIHYEGDVILSEMEHCLDKEVCCMFPYINTLTGFRGRVQLAAICIEVEEDE